MTQSNPALSGTANPLATITDDIDGDPRDLVSPDMGADEFVNMAKFKPEIQGLDAQIQVYPNSFQHLSLVAVTLAQDCKISVDILNLTGQKIQTISEKELQSGLHIIPITTDLPESMYFCRITISKGKETKTFIQKIIIIP